MPRDALRLAALALLLAAAAGQNLLGKSAESADPIKAPSAGDVLGQMTAGNAEGWSLAFLNGEAPPFTLTSDANGISASDTAGTDAHWYFVGPAAFSGDMRAAYNGKLTFSIVQLSVADAKAKKDLKAPLVVLQAECGHYLWWSPATLGSGATTVMLNEDAGWKDSRTGRAAGVMDVLGVLSHLSHIKIRGGFFKTSAETTRLSGVQLMASGKSWYPCCTLSNEVDLCQKKPTAWFNPSNLVFYCEGSLRKTIKVTKVYPRFARRTGGASITVEGQNFGLSGSQPIVRIGGRQCETTRFAASSQTDTPREKLNNKDGNALLNAWNTATDSMKSMYPEHCWNGMKDDGTDKGFNYGTAAAPKYINQGETGIDTGGPCFPSHCSSCPDNNKAWCSSNQIEAVSSGTCKGRGNQDVACAATFPYQHYPNLCPDNAEATLSATVVSAISKGGGETTSTASRVNSPTLTSSQTTFDLMDVRITTLATAVTTSATTITVAGATDLVCQNHNLATRDCSADGVAADLVENYLKITAMDGETQETAQQTSEIVKVLSVATNVLTVQRAQGGTTATAFATAVGGTSTAAIVQMCGKHAECLVNSNLKDTRFIKVDDEVMAVTGAGVIAHVSLGAAGESDATCGDGYTDGDPITVTCAGGTGCHSDRAMAGTITTDSGGEITAVTITDFGSGYHPGHLPTIATTSGNNGGTACTLTPHWSSVSVSRGAALTTAAAHSAAPVTVSRMDCINDDETGDNCGGTCKPCPSRSMGPDQQDTVVCKAPEAVRGVSVRDLAVTVEATPGPKHSPYGTRMSANLKGWADAAVAGVSCISEQSRGFAYGAHDFEWASALRPSGGSVHTTSLTVDVNSGETYITGTMQAKLTIKGKHIMSKLQMGQLEVEPAATMTTTCTGAANREHWVSGVGNKDCGLVSFIARFSKEGKALYLNKLEATGTTKGVYQTVITDAEFDSSASELYVVGYMNDGDSTSMEKPTLLAYDIDVATRVSKATASGSLAGATIANDCNVYQEGFLLKYRRDGSLVWMRSIKAERLAAKSGLLVSHLRVAAYKASTSSIINTATAGQGNAPTVPTHTTQRDVEFDSGTAQGAVQGGTGTDSTVTLKAEASGTSSWYNGLSIRITRGKGYGQVRRIYEYDGSSKVAKVTPHWDPHDTPDSTSRYVIEGGRPSSFIAGTHWTNGGVYVTATVETVCGTDCHTGTSKYASMLRIGEMNAVYRDSNAVSTPKYVDVSLGHDTHEDFLAQFDNEGKVYWARFVGVNGVSGKIDTSVTPTTTSLKISGGYGEFAGTTMLSGVDDFYNGATITFIDGNKKHHARFITDYVGTTNVVTFDPALDAAPDSATRFIISSRGTVARASAGTATTVTLPAGGDRVKLDDAFVGASVVIVDGTGMGQHATIQAYVGSTRVATITTLATAPDATSELHIMDSSSIKGIAVMRDAVFLTGSVTTSGTRVQNCTFDSATVTEGPPENTHPVTVFECAVAGAPQPADYSGVAIAGSTPTDVSFGNLAATTDWGMYTVAYNGSGSVAWTQVTDGGAIFPKAIVAMDPSIGGKPLAGVWGGGVDSKSVASRSQPPDGTRAQDVGALGVDSAVVDGPYVYVAAEVADYSQASDFGVTALPRACSQGKTIGSKAASTARLDDQPCAGQVVAKGTAANSWPGVNAGLTDIVLAQLVASTGQVQQLRRTGMTDKRETVTSLAAHALTGAVFVAGQYYATAVQGTEASGAGDDVFGLDSAQRGDSVGCPRQRWDGDLALGKSGVPDCRLYSNSASATLGTGFVIKYTMDGDGATSARRQLASLSGYLKAASTAAACSGGAAETDGANHVLTGGSACSTHPSGCSCLEVVFKSRTISASSIDTDDTTSPYGVGPLSRLSGYKIRIVAGKSQGYEGIISAYSAAAGRYNTIPALPASGVDETSAFQLFPYARHTPRLHEADCNQARDEGCAAYGVEWAKTVGYAIGGGSSSSAWSSGVALAESDSNIYVAGHYSGFQGGWAGYATASRTVAPAAGSPSFGVEGVDEVIGFDNAAASVVASFLSKLTD